MCIRIRTVYGPDRRASKLEAHAEEVRASVTDRLMAGENIASIFELTNDGPAEIAQMDAAITSCRGRRLAMISASFPQKAEALRVEAASKQAEAKAIERKTGRLLAELSKIEGVSYGQEILLASRVGGWPESSIINGLTRHRCTPLEMNPEAFGSSYHLPKSELLRREADQILLQARDIEAGPQWPLDAGEFTTEGVSTEAELVVLLFADPAIVAPPAVEVAGWYRRVSKGLRIPTIRGSEDGYSRPTSLIPTGMRIRLVWTNFRIDEGQSYVQLTGSAAEAAA